MRRSIISTALGLAAVATAVFPVSANTADESPQGRNPYTRDAITYIFNGEANNLNAYDNLTWEKYRVITNAQDRPHVQGDFTNGLDINAQICFDPLRTDGYFFIAGEDTGQAKTSVGGGQGWGYFELQVDPDTLDPVGAIQRGKVEPRYFETDSDNPENYGCGFLSNGDLVTSDVGDQFPQDPASGELILWFRPDTPGGFATGADPVTATFPLMPYCKIDVNIPTAGQIWIGPDDSIYVGAQRPDTAGGNPDGRPNGIYRFTPPDGGWPTSPEGCTATHDTAHFEGEPDPMVEGYGFEVFIQGGGPNGTTPTGIVPVPEGRPNAGNFYMSSVFDGRITEHAPDGTFVRTIMQPEGSESLPYRKTGTPLGIGVDPNTGTIYFADIAILAQTGLEGGDPTGFNPGAGPGPNGMVRAIEFDENNEPGESIPVNGGLAFPDGIGVVTIERAIVAGSSTTPTSGGDTPAPAPGVLPVTGGPMSLPIVLGALSLGVALGRKERRATTE